MDDYKESLLSDRNPNQKNSRFGSSRSEYTSDPETTTPWVVHQEYPRPSRRSMYLLAAATFSFFLSISLILVQSHLQTQILERTHCGNSTTEARANGCILDFIAGAWVHPACYDSELEAEFLSLSDWHWFADAAGTKELSFSFIQETGGPNPIFVSPEYHRQHCVYTWRKLHRAVILHTPIDTHIGSYSHTQHCSKGLARPDAHHLSKFFSIFTECKMPKDCKWIEKSRFEMAY